MLYSELEKAVCDLPDVEIVYRDRYALFRTSRIFADIVIMKEAVRVAVHLKRQVEDPLFFKIVSDERGHVSHVAKINTRTEIRAILPYVLEAHQLTSSSK
jgi:predicted transport protein